MITVGRMAEKYGMLPHQVEQQATTYDLMVQDVLQAYDDHMEVKQKGGLASVESLNLSEDDMTKILEKSRER